MIVEWMKQFQMLDWCNVGVGMECQLDCVFVNGVVEGFWLVFSIGYYFYLVWVQGVEFVWGFVYWYLFQICVFGDQKVVVKVFQKISVCFLGIGCGKKVQEWVGGEFMCFFEQDKWYVGCCFGE